MAEYQVAERFISINGEGRRAGQLAVFIRFKGCGLACSYCDTRWANQTDTQFQIQTAQELAEYIRGTGVRNVTLTGGEPLMQEGIGQLIRLLAEHKEYFIEIETNGSMPIQPYARRDGQVAMTMDYKLPSSGMEHRMCLDNFSYLKEQDTVKFVCGTMEDLERSAQIMGRYALTQRCAVYLSPVFGQMEPAQMVEFMKDRQMNGVNLQLQLHKLIWNPEERGV